VNAEFKLSDDPKTGKKPAIQIETKDGTEDL